ncbi:MAG: SUF system Fe-S cluster assembly regulator [Candidatus Binatia bacterium]|nr:SUF system Fe-S cluster assembly regulator [Candidatus Binatia bacterium]
MVRISRLTDYAIVLLVRMGAEPQRLHRAGELSASTHLPLPTVSKLLRMLTRKGLLRSQRGVHGGYQLTSKPEDLHLAEVIGRLEGPLGLTVCTHEGPGRECRHQLLCPVQGHWQYINRAFVTALQNVTLADLVGGAAVPPTSGSGPNQVPEVPSTAPCRA